LHEQRGHDDYDRFMPKLNTNSTQDGVEIGDDVGSELRFDAETLASHAITTEYSLLCKRPLDGVYAVPSSSNYRVWFGVIFVRRGVYMGAMLRFSLAVDDQFPDTNQLPTITFDYDVFHPNIDATTRQLDISRYFPDGWKSGTHHLYHTLIALQRTFFQFDTTNAINADAATLLRCDKSRFKSMAIECVKKSRAFIYDAPLIDDQNSIRFTPWDATIHEPIRKQILADGDRSGEMSQQQSTRSTGLSFVDAHDLRYMVEPVIDLSPH